MKYLFFGFLIFLGFSFSACYYDNAEDLYPETAVCKTADMSYSDNIKPILNFYCISCHSTASPQGNVNLEGYDNLKISVNNGTFVKSIKHASGVSPMPKNQDKLDDCTIKKVEAWIAQGALNN